VESIDLSLRLRLDNLVIDLFDCNRGRRVDLFDTSKGGKFLRRHYAYERAVAYPAVKIIGGIVFSA
jgi:hypothetical protein